MSHPTYVIYLDVFTHHISKTMKTSTFGYVIYESNEIVADAQVDIKQECPNTAGYLLALYDALDIISDMPNDEAINIIIVVPDQQNKKYTTNVVASIGAILSKYRTHILSQPSAQPEEIREQLRKELAKTNQKYLDEKMMIGGMLFSFVQQDVNLYFELTSADAKQPPFEKIFKTMKQRWAEVNKTKTAGKTGNVYKY